MSDIEQSVPSRIGEYEFDLGWPQTVGRRVHCRVQDVVGQGTRL